MMISDLADSRSPLNRAVESAEEAVSLLESAGDRQPFLCLLESPEHELLIGEVRGSVVFSIVRVSDATVPDGGGIRTGGSNGVWRVSERRRT
jgi:hypothetical protein